MSDLMRLRFAFGGGGLKTPDGVQESVGEELRPEPEPDPEGLLRNDSPYTRSRRVSVIVVLAAAATALLLIPFWPFPTAPFWPTVWHLGGRRAHQQHRLVPPQVPRLPPPARRLRHPAGPRLRGSRVSPSRSGNPPTT